jgi:hypothetical protein
MDHGQLGALPYGRLRPVAGLIGEAIELDDRVNCKRNARWSGADPAIVARDLVEMAARPLGYLDRSLMASEQSMAIALEWGHLFSIVWASVARVLALTSFGRYSEAVDCADNALAICEKHGFETRIGNVLQQGLHYSNSATKNAVWRIFNAE